MKNMLKMIPMLLLAAAGIFMGNVAIGLMAPIGAKIAMAGISKTQLASELGSYFRTYHEQVRDMIYSPNHITKWFRPIYKVKGKFPAPHGIMDRVIQGFATTWNAMGTMNLKAKELTNYHVKVNFGFVPDDVLNSWLAFLATEKKKKTEWPISRYIMENHLPKAIQRDLTYLYGKGAYDANDLGTFGKAMNGLNALLTTGTTSSTYPMYKIPSGAINASGSNAVTVINDFEKRLPEIMQDMTDIPLFMSMANLNKYREQAVSTYGAVQNFTKDDMTRSFLTGRPIVGLPILNGYDWIFCTPAENMVRMHDEIDTPVITDVQVADYTVKAFFEWWDGPEFWINQLVAVNVTAGSGSGLTSDQTTYYANDSVS